MKLAHNLAKNSSLGFNYSSLRFYDGIQNTANVDAVTQRKVNAKVVDNILNSRTYGARLLGRGKPMMGKTFDYPVKIAAAGGGQWFVGLENLNSAAANTLVNLSYAHTAFMQPAVSIMTEAFANSGPQGVIDLQEYKLEEAVAEAVQNIGTAIYGTGASNQPLGLGAIVDDGSAVGTIGGQSRTTYTNLKATVTAAGSGKLSLTNLATLFDTISAAGLVSEEPNIGLTDKPTWSLYESLLQPAVRAEYASVGYNSLALRGDNLEKSEAQLKGAAGFTALSFRGRPVIKDDAATTGVFFLLNERYFEWRGRTIIPEGYDYLDKVNLGDNDILEGVGAEIGYDGDKPNGFGWFCQPYMMIPQQAGMIARYYLIGQVTTSQFRRQGKLTSITTV